MLNVTMTLTFRPLFCKHDFFCPTMISLIFFLYC